MIVLKNVNKTFIQGDSNQINVLNNISFEILENQWISISGTSGSGKSTLLSLLAGLDIPSSGTIKFNDLDYTQLDEDKRAKLRAENMGFIFQNFRLMPHMNALDNVRLPLELINATGSIKIAKEMLVKVGLESRVDHFPNELSGGEQQRVAIARAFVSQPKILFADEPTGNLDTKNETKILKLMTDLKSEFKTSLVIVTHDQSVAKMAQKIIQLKDGCIV